MLKQLITYVGLDVHEETIAVALAEADKRSARASPVSGSRRTGGMRSISPNCIGLVN